jgi:hypothetical protein
MLENGALNKRFQEKYMQIQHQKRKKRNLKKYRTITWYWYPTSKPKKESTISLDEFFFFYDSLATKVWTDKEKRPVVMITG